MNTKLPSFLITLLIACFEPSHPARAVNPPPDGGYPGGTTAEGDRALLNLTSGSYNTALGFRTLEKNTEGDFNTAIGAAALLLNTAASENTATGAAALLQNAPPLVSGGDGNTADGALALFNNNTGSFNTAIGDRALFNNTSGSNNIALGDSAGSSITTANNAICIGVAGTNVSNSCFVGNVFGKSVGAGSVPVVIDSSGKLGTFPSSCRFKKEIKPMDSTSEAVLALKPVTFRYKSDDSGTPQFGLIAEEVAEVNPDLVVRDESGKTYTVRYDAVNAMLLNEFLKEHRKVQEQETRIAELKCDAIKQRTAVLALEKGMEAISARLERQDAKIQKMNDQLEIGSSSAQQLADNHR